MNHCLRKLYVELLKRPYIMHIREFRGSFYIRIYGADLMDFGIHPKSYI